MVDFRGKGRQQVLEDLALEFPVVDGQWTPTVKVADGVLLRLVSTYRHLGTRRGPELAARRSGRKKILSQRRLSKKARVAVARAVVSSRLLYGAGAWHSLSASDIGAMEDTYMAPFRTIRSGKLAGCVSSVRHSRLPGGGQHAEIAFGGTAGQCFSLVDGSPAV